MLLNQIKTTIESNVPDSTAYIMDPYNDGAHLQAIVVSPAFSGISLVKQHQMVMKPLKQAFETAVHALGLKTFTPDEWQKEKHNYNV